MTARRVGGLALEYVYRTAKYHDPMRGPSGGEALADLRALMAAHEERSREAASTAAERDRLRAALDEADASAALYFNEVAKAREESARVRSAVESAIALLREGKRPSVAVCAAMVHLMSTVEERSGAAASTAGEGVKP